MMRLTSPCLDSIRCRDDGEPYKLAEFEGLPKNSL